MFDVDVGPGPFAGRVPFGLFFIRPGLGLIDPATNPAQCPATPPLQLRISFQSFKFDAPPKGILVTEIPQEINNNNHPYRHGQY
jgi:hypothetical protein